MEFIEVDFLLLTACPVTNPSMIIFPMVKYVFHRRLKMNNMTCMTMTLPTRQRYTNMHAHIIHTMGFFPVPSIKYIYKALINLKL